MKIGLNGSPVINRHEEKLRFDLRLFKCDFSLQKNIQFKKMLLKDNCFLFKINILKIFLNFLKIFLRDFEKNFRNFLTKV
jgi:hypothetical protein